MGMRILADKIKPAKRNSRINYCTRILRNVLLFSGFVLLVVQLVKAFSLLSSGESLGSSEIATSILAILFLWFGVSSLLNNAVITFAARIRYPRWQTYVYIFPLLLTGLILWAKIKVGATSDEWQQISYEGGLSEYGTAIAYLLMPWFTLPIAKQFWQQKKKLMGCLYYLLTFSTIFIGMEEISWGQRLIGFEEPEFWSKHNAQSEFTFHNLSFFHEHLLDQSFLVLGFLGSFGWIALRYWLKNGRSLDFSYIVPDWFLSSFFYPTLIFHIIFATAGKLDFFITRDQEHCEFILSIGILLFVIINFLRQEASKDRVTGLRNALKD